MRILIESDSLIQFIVATHLRTTVFKDDEVDLLMYNSMPAAEKLFENIKDSGLYNNCYIISSVLGIGITKLPLGGKIKKHLRWLEMLYSPLKGTQRDLVLENYKYDLFVYCANGIFLEGLFNVCRKVNPKMKCFRYEGSLTSYLHDNENAKGTFRIYFENIFKQHYKGLNLSGCVDKYYFFEPDLIQYKHNYVIDRLPKITSMDGNIIQMLNNIFDYSKTKDRINERFVAFEDGNLYFMNNSEEVAIYNHTAEILGKNDFVVKLHPRNNCYRYNPELVRVNKAIAPWEIYLLNQNISGKTLITSASGSIFTSLIYFGMDVNIILIYKLIKEKIPLLNSNFEHLLASISKQTQAKIFIPESYDELKSILMKLTNK